MSVFAVIENGRVQNRIKADPGHTIPGTLLIDITALQPQPEIGYLHHGGTSFSVDLVARKRALKQVMNALRQERQASGLIYRGKTFQTDESSLQAITRTAALAATGRETQDITWRTSDNSDLTLTPEQFARLLDLVDRYIRQIARHAHITKDAIDAASNEAELAAIDLYSGWPDNDSGEMP